MTTGRFLPYNRRGIHRKMEGGDKTTEPASLRLNRTNNIFSVAEMNAFKKRNTPRMKFVGNLLLFFFLNQKLHAARKSENLFPVFGTGQ